MAAAKKLTAQQQRDRRAKIMLAVLGGVLLLVVGLQVPKLMNSGGGGSAAPPPATTGALPTSGIAAAPLAVPAEASQLTHFSKFKAKDPFKAGVSPAQPASPASTPAKSTPPAAKSTPTVTTPVKPPLTLTLSQTQPKPVVPVGPRVPAAILKVNGKRQVVALDTPFPAKHPIFTLIAVGGKTVWLRLIGGSLANGSQTIKLVHGEKITLVNSTVNLRIILALVKPTTAPKPTATTTPVSTTPAATTTSATTTAAPPPTTTTTG